MKMNKNFNNENFNQIKYHCRTKSRDRFLETLKPNLIKKEFFY